MATIMSTGQITIVDLTDQRSSSFYLQANRSKIQTHDVNNGTYSPNYASGEPITVTPSFFFGNEDYSSSIEQGDISYYINGSTEAVTKYSAVDSANGDCYQVGANLTIAQNIGQGTLTGTILRVKAVIEANKIQDLKTKLYNSKIEATIEFARVDSGVDGDRGASVTKVEQQYLLTESSTIVPNASDSGWSTTHGEWSEGKYLWIRTAITYYDVNANPTTWTEYTAPYCDSSWKAAADGVLSLSERIDGVDELIEALQKEVDGAIETWYLEGDPTASGFENPWPSTDTNEEHIGDLYFDTKTGKSYRYFKQSDDSYTWQIITDTELTQAMSDIKDLQTVVDGKVTIYYDEAAPALDGVYIDDLWIKPDGNFYQCIGTKNADGTETNKSWSLANISIDSVTIEYAESTSNTAAPTSGWSTTSPAWKADAYVWQRTVTTFKDGAKDTIYSDPVCISAAAARSIVISGEQVFKSVDGETYSPSSIALTANCMGGLTAGTWYYKNGNSWVETSTTGNTFNITSGHAAFGSGTTATIKVVSTQGENYYDVISLYKVADGQNGDDGAPASSVFLTNENITFAGDKDGQVTAITLTSNVVAYTGTTKVTPAVGTISGMPTGMSATKGGASNDEIPITIKITDKATLGGVGTQNGTLTVPITAPVATTLYITWSKVNTGATGANGIDAVFAVVESTTGKVVFTDEESGDITLKASLYKGGAVQTSNVSYSWTSVPTGITGTTQTLEVSRDKVPSARSFVCTITYDGKTYTDSIALSDKTDAIYCTVESSAGDKFTNGNITTTLKCRVFDAYGEVDTAGTKYTYTWEKYVDGVKDANWRTTGSVTGKTVSIDSDDVSAKATFSCIITSA